jgi:hypothetical protein
VRRRGAQSDKETRTYGLDLIKQPVSAYLYLTRVRAFVQPPFAPLLELEMLDRVRHIDALAVQAGITKGFIQQKPCRSDERSALAVFSVPGLFANEHHVCVWRPFTENGLRGVFPKRARLAGRSPAPQRVELTARFAIGVNAHGLTKYSTRIQARRARATLPMST